MLKLLMKVHAASLFDAAIARSRRSERKSAKWKTILMSLLIAYAVVVMLVMEGVLFAVIGESMMQHGMTDIFMALAGLLITMISITFTIFMAKSLLYEARDNELLLSMPIKPSVIFASRMLLLVIIENLTALIMSIPLIVVYCLYGQVTPLDIVMIPVGLILLSLLAVSISTVIGCAVGWLAAHLPYKNIITVVLFMIFFGAYFWVVMELEKLMMDLLMAGAALGQAAATAFPPAYHFGAAVAGDLSAVPLLVLWCVGPFAAVWYGTSRLFFKMVTTNKGERHIAYKAKEMKTASPLAALIKKELRRIFTMSAYMLNACMGVVFHIIMAVALIFMGGSEIRLLAGAMGMSDMLPYLCIVAVCFCATVNITTAPSLSLEGNNLWILKSLPIHPRTVYAAKVLTGLLVSLPSLMVLEIVILILIPMTPMQMIWLLVLPVLMQLFTNVFGLMANIWFPVFDWINPVTVIKQSTSTLIGMLGPMVACILPVALYLVLPITVNMDLFLLGCFVVLAGAVALCWEYIIGKGSEKFLRM